MPTAGRRRAFHSTPPTPAVLAYYGRALRLARQRKGLTQQALADAAGLSCAAISHAEQGKYFLRMDHSATLARLLGVSLTHLLPEDPESAAARLYAILLQHPPAMTTYLIKMLENVTPVQGCPLHSVPG